MIITIIYKLYLKTPTSLKTQYSHQRIKAKIFNKINIFFQFLLVKFKSQILIQFIELFQFFQFISIYFNLFQFISIYFNLFQFISIYFNLFQFISIYFNYIIFLICLSSFNSLLFFLNLLISLKKIFFLYYIFY
jgi:hypothetical protein